MKFIKIGYFKFGRIYRIFIEKSNTKNLLKNYLTTLIQGTKSINKKIFEFEYFY